MLYSIQFLRFIAAFLVVLNHSSQDFANQTWVLGAAGVDIFFVISGVVITLSTKEGMPAAYFLARRATRIYPFFWLATAFFILFTWYAWDSFPTWQNLLRSVFLIPEFGYQRQPVYFPAWTLYYELLFYIVFGVLLALKVRQVAFTSVLIMLFLSIAKIPVPFREPGVYFENNIVLEFAAGVVIALFHQRGLRLSRNLATKCVMVAVAIFVITPQPDYSRELQWGVPAALLVFGFIHFEDKSWLHARLISLLGDASYAIYLTHITIMQFMGEVFAWNGIILKDYPLFAIPLTIVVPTVVGLQIHVMIEKPMLLKPRNLTATVLAGRAQVRTSSLASK